MSKKDTGDQVVEIVGRIFEANDYEWNIMTYLQIVKVLSITTLSNKLIYYNHIRVYRIGFNLIVTYNKLCLHVRIYSIYTLNIPLNKHTYNRNGL